MSYKQGETRLVPLRKERKNARKETVLEHMDILGNLWSLFDGCFNTKSDGMIVNHRRVEASIIIGLFTISWLQAQYIGHLLHQQPFFYFWKPKQHLGGVKFWPLAVTFCFVHYLKNSWQHQLSNNDILCGKWSKKYKLKPHRYHHPSFLHTYTWKFCHVFSISTCRNTHTTSSC